jgi:threonine dehydrogenase-like Zn-dependent dehydrogenase
MPLELILEGPKIIGFRSYEERPPTGTQVLVETTVSGIKSGTEINLYRGTAPFVTQLWDPALRLFRDPVMGEEVAPFFPHTLGSWAAGKVKAVGPDARRFKVGDLVHGDWKHRRRQNRDRHRRYPGQSLEGDLSLRAVAGAVCDAH